MATEEAEPAGVIKRITDQITQTGNVRVVFGEPTTLDGVTIVPVAGVRVRGGGGGGGGGGRKAGTGDQGRGMGLGLRLDATPVGYVEVRNGETRFVEIVDRTRIALAAMAAAVLGLALIGRLIARLTRHRSR
jgi:uncharacterized spore protein YtfJ